MSPLPIHPLKDEIMEPVDEDDTSSKTTRSSTRRLAQGGKSWSRLAVEGGARQDSGSSCYSGDSDYTERAKMRTTLDIMDQSTLAESLAISKVQLASKQEALEKLELSYLKLEKLHTQLKLELAEVKAEKDVA